MTNYTMASGAQIALPHKHGSGLLGSLASLVYAWRWARQVQHRCDRAVATGRILDGDTIREIADAADAALGHA